MIISDTIEEGGNYTILFLGKSSESVLVLFAPFSEGGASANIVVFTSLVSHSLSLVSSTSQFLWCPWGNLAATFRYVYVLCYNGVVYYACPDVTNRKQLFGKSLGLQTPHACLVFSKYSTINLPLF